MDENSVLRQQQQQEFDRYRKEVENGWEKRIQDDATSLRDAETREEVAHIEWSIKQSEWAERELKSELIGVVQEWIWPGIAKVWRRDNLLPLRVGDQVRLKSVYYADPAEAFDVVHTVTDLWDSSGGRIEQLDSFGRYFQLGIDRFLPDDTRVYRV